MRIANVLALVLLITSVGCAHSATTQPPPARVTPDPAIAADLFYRFVVIKHDVYRVDQGWDGDVSAVASQVARGWHQRGVSTDFQHESREGTRISFGAWKKGGDKRYKVIVQELSREPGIVLVLYAAWPEDLDAAFSKQFEIEADEIVRRLVIEEVPATPPRGSFSI